MAKYEGEVLNEKPGEVSGAVTPPVDFEAQYKDKAEKLKADYDKKVKDLTTTTLKVGGDTYEIPSVLTSTPVVAAATVAGLYGAKKVGEYALDKASSALEGIKNRMINKNSNVVDVQSRTIVPEDIPEEWRALYEKSQQNAASKAADAAARVNPVPQNYTPGVPSVQPNVPVNPAGAFTQPSGYGATTSNIPSQIGQPNIGGAPVVPTAEVGPVPVIPSAQVGVQTGNVSKAVQAIAAQELDKATGATPIEKPAPKAKKPIDPSEAGLTKQEIGMKRYLESFYGGGEVGAKTYAQVGDILGYRPAFEPGKGGGLKPEENAVIKGYRKENIEGPKVNLDKDMKRALKTGAGLTALMAIPGFADAAQRKDYGRMADLASDFVVPPFAGSTELGVSTLGEKQLKAFENAQKLGSPYRSVPPR